MAHAASPHPRDLTDEQWALMGPISALVRAGLLRSLLETSRRHSTT